MGCKTINIVYLVEDWGEPWNEGYKNIARYIYRLLKNLPKLDVNVKVLTRRNVEWDDLKGHHLIWLFNYPESLGAIFHLIKLKLNTRGHVIKFVAKKEIDVNYKEKLKTALYRKYAWDIVVITTKLLGLEVARYFPYERIYVLPPPIPIDYFYPLNKGFARKILGCREDLFYIAYSGKVNKYVNLDILAESLRETSSLKNIVLLLSLSYFTGRKELDRLLSVFKKVNIPIRFVHVNDVRILYSATDLLIYPVQREGSIEPPLTILEAMSCGTVVVALENPSLKTIIRNGHNGFVFRTPSELRSVIEQLYWNQHKLYNIGKEARNTIIETFSPARLIQTYSDFLSKLLI